MASGHCNCVAGVIETKKAGTGKIVGGCLTFSIHRICKIQKCNFMLFWRYMYRSRIQDFQELIRRISSIFRHASFPYFVESQGWCFSRWKFPKHVLELSWFKAELRIMGLWGSLTFPLALEIINMKTFRFVGQWTFQSTSIFTALMPLPAFYTIVK